MKKRAETCVKVVYRILPKPHNPSEIKGSERTHAKTLDFTGLFRQAFSLSGRQAHRESQRRL